MSNLDQFKVEVRDALVEVEGEDEEGPYYRCLACGEGWGHTYPTAEPPITALTTAAMRLVEAELEQTIRDFEGCRDTAEVDEMARIKRNTLTTPER